MAVNEGLQPLDQNSQTPVDPNVRIPDHVARAARVAEDIHKQAYTPPEPQAQVPQPEPQAPQPEPQAQVPQPEPQPQQVEPQPLKPGDENVTAEEWRHRFLSMQGRFSQATKTIGSMEVQMGDLARELQHVQSQLTQQVQQPVHQVSQPVHNNLITDADREAYGDELIDLARRAAQSAVAPELDDLRARNESLTKQVRSEAKRGLFAKLDGQLPQWRQINQDVRFKSWLRLPNIYTGQVRQEMLRAAVDGAEAPKVLQLFKDFLTEATATGQMPTAQPQEQPAQQQPPREAAVSLEALASPGRARPASGDSQVPSEKPIYSRADITRFYDEKRRGLWANRIKEAQDFENDLSAAQREGRIRG